MTDTSAPTPARLNILQLLDLAKEIVWELSPRVSICIGDLMFELVRIVEVDEPLLRERLEISFLESESEDRASIGGQNCL